MSGPRSAGHAIVDQLAAAGVRRVYCVPGESYLDVLDGLYAADIDTVITRAEGGASFMAVADGRLGPAPGVAMVTRGPGAANAAIGVHTAWTDATAMLLFVGLIPIADRDRESFQEFDIRAWFGTTAKAVLVLDEPGRAAETVRDAVHLALSGRPGPVVIGLPEDVLVGPCEGGPLPARALARGAVADDDLAELRRRLTEATRPLVVVGGDQLSGDGSRDLARFAEAWSIPVVSDFRAHDRVDHSGSVWCGWLGYGRCDCTARLLDKADLVLFLGAVNSDVLSDGYTLGRPERVTVLAGADPDLGGHHGGVDLQIIAHPDVVAHALAQLTCEQTPTWAADTRLARSSWLEFATPAPDGAAPGFIDLGAAFEVLAREVGPDAVITYGAGNHAIWAQRYLACAGPGTLLAPRNGAMGFGIPAAVAAALADPGRRVVSIAGDGCFLMNGQELATAAARGADLTVIVIDNGQYGTIREHQERHYPGRVSGTQLINPDFALLAAAFGGHGERVDQLDDLPAALKRALDQRGVSLLHLRSDPSVLQPAGG